MATAGEDEARRSPSERPRRRRSPERSDGASERSGDRRAPRERDADRAENGQSGGGPMLKAVDAAQLAVRQVQELTGRQPEGVTSLERGDEGWLVGVEVVESHRVPDSSDIMAVYQAQLDESGDLVAYHRVDRYPRGRGN